MNATWQYFTSNANEIWHWTLTTIWLAALPLVAGLICALPIGWLASRYRVLYLPLVTVGGVFYTIPSLVLFITVPGIIHTTLLNTVNVAIALFIYTLALMIRVVADGLTSVPKDTLAAASAMGYTGSQRLFGVQMPMAVPVIGAGLRVAAVSNVSLVSVASLIGIAQLGSLFLDGNINGTLPPVILGLLFFIVLALIFDGVILLLVRLLTPWQRVAVAR